MQANATEVLALLEENMRISNSLFHKTVSVIYCMWIDWNRFSQQFITGTPFSINITVPENTYWNLQQQGQGKQK